MKQRHFITTLCLLMLCGLTILVDHFLSYL